MSTTVVALSQLYRFRELVGMLVARDLKVRYKRSVLGMFWSLLNPLMQMAVYSFVFSTVLKVGTEAYPVFLLSGLLPWGLFVGSVSGSAGSLLSNAGLIRKVQVPQAVYPLSIVGSKFVDLALSLIPLTLLSFYYGKYPAPSWLFVLPAAVFMLALSAGFSLAISSLTVFFRDTKHLIDIVLQIWFYLTPILYPYDALERIPNRLIPYLLKANPATPVIRCFQTAIYEGRFPDTHTVALAALYSFGALFLGMFAFLRVEHRHIHYL